MPQIVRRDLFYFFIKKKSLDLANVAIYIVAFSSIKKKTQMKIHNILVYTSVSIGTEELFKIQHIVNIYYFVVVRFENLFLFFSA